MIITFEDKNYDDISFHFHHKIFEIGIDIKKQNIFKVLKITYGIGFNTLFLKLNNYIKVIFKQVQLYEQNYFIKITIPISEVQSYYF